MKSVKISRLSVVCVLCAAGLSPVFAASSVRNLGGSGTYSSASNAAAARSGSAAINSARAGSVRATTGSTAKAVGSTGASAGSARTASNTARLSVGSYLQGGKTIQGGSSIKSQNPASSSSTSNNNNSNTVIQEQVDQIRVTIDALQDADSERYTISETDDLLDNKQDILVAGDGIDITDGVISAIVVDGKQVLLQSDGTHIQWKYDDVSGAWQDLVALADLQGPQGIQGQKGDKGDTGDAANLTDYSTTAEILTLIQNAINLSSTNYATVAQGGKADTAVQPEDLTAYATKTEVTNAVNNAITNVNVELTDYTKTDDLGALALKNTVATADINDANVTKAKLAADVQTSLGLADTALQPGDAPDVSGAPSDGSDYVLVMNSGTETWLKVAY